jgi:polysaccharide pyruvyl transferase WcaK-like protein
MNKTAWVFTELLFMITQTINIYTFKICPYKLAFGHKKTALYDFTNSEVCISISGELINDSFRKVLPFYLFMYWLAWKLGNKVIIFPQSIGPLNRKWTRTLTKYVLEKCIIASDRDKVSHEELTSLGSIIQI